MKHHAMRECVSMEVKFHAYLISSLDGDEWSASRLTSFTHYPVRKFWKQEKFSVSNVNETTILRLSNA